jgi:hypothetical protein
MTENTIKSMTYGEGDTKVALCSSGHKVGRYNVNYVTKELECAHAHCNAPIYMFGATQYERRKWSSDTNNGLELFAKGFVDDFNELESKLGLK